jgi:hypothetical protein
MGQQPQSDRPSDREMIDQSVTTLKTRSSSFCSSSWQHSKLLVFFSLFFLSRFVASLISLLLFFQQKNAHSLSRPELIGLEYFDTIATMGILVGLPTFIKEVVLGGSTPGKASKCCSLSPHVSTCDLSKT